MKDNGGKVFSQDKDNETKARQSQLLVAVAALLGSGALVALSTNLAKIAYGIGVAPLPFLTWALAGATVLLWTMALLQRQRVSISRRAIEYFLLAAFFSVAGANLIFFKAVPHVGVSFVMLTMSLPPVLTYVFALTLRMESFCWWRAAGVVFALSGASLLVLGQWKLPKADSFWIGLTLLGPVLLAVGNIYRTLRWPEGANAKSLALGMLLAATFLLTMAAFAVPRWSLDIPAYSVPVLALIAVQAVIFAAQFVLLFILQKAGGPVFMSLMGMVSSVIGVPVAMVLFAEPLLPALVPGAVLIAAGISSMIIGTRKQST